MMTYNRQHEHRRYVLSAVAIALSFAGAAAPSRAANLAFIDGGSGVQTPGTRWCAFFEKHGHTCTVLPITGPDVPLDPFDVVIDMSPEWSDPDGLLADVLRSGRGVITRNRAPIALGIETDPTVRAWIGANEASVGNGLLLTVAPDPILGSLPIGSDIGGGGFPDYAAVLDTAGHPHAKILAEFETGTIGLLRNAWEGGRSVYMSDAVTDDAFLAAIAELGPQIPAVSTWGVIVMLLLVLSLGTILFRKLARSIASVR